MKTMELMSSHIHVLNDGSEYKMKGNKVWHFRESARETCAAD